LTRSAFQIGASLLKLLYYHRTWEAQGITWKKSFNEYKAFFKRWPGNYVVTEIPHNKEFMGKECFTARISSIAQDNGMLYQLDMQFGYAEGE
jgi:hypothetical protein